MQSADDGSPVLILGGTAEARTLAAALAASGRRVVSALAGRVRDPALPPEHQQAIAAGIRGAALLTVAPAAHIANIEQPQHVTDALLAHLGGAA